MKGRREGRGRGGAGNCSWRVVGLGGCCRCIARQDGQEARRAGRQPGVHAARCARSQARTQRGLQGIP